MFRSFYEIEHHIKIRGVRKTIALAGAQDANALEAVVYAKRQGVISAILIGDTAKIEKLLKEMNEPVSDYEVTSCHDELACAKLAVSLVKAGRADMPMKGLLQTANFMRAILDKSDGLLPDGALLSQATLFQYPDQDRLIIATDCAVNIAPTLPEKVKIINSAICLAHALGVDYPKGAALSSVEKVNPKIQSSVDADALARMNWDGCIVEGPLALDNAISKEAATHKGIAGKVAGSADILIMPDLDAGNILHKSLHFFAHLESAGILCGTTHPVILTSRTDSPETKYRSVLVAILQMEAIGDSVASPILKIG